MLVTLFNIFCPSLSCKIVITAMDVAGHRFLWGCGGDSGLFGRGSCSGVHQEARRTRCLWGHGVRRFGYGGPVRAGVCSSPSRPYSVSGDRGFVLCCVDSWRTRLVVSRVGNFQIKFDPADFCLLSSMLRLVSPFKLWQKSWCSVTQNNYSLLHPSKHPQQSQNIVPNQQK